MSFASREPVAPSRAARRLVGGPQPSSMRRAARRLAARVEPASFIAEGVAPAAGARHAALRVAAEGDRPGAGDHGDSLPHGGRARERDDGVGGHDQAPGAQDRRQDRLLILRTAAHAEARRLETNGRRVEARILARRLQAGPYALFEACAALARRGVVARPPDARAENAPGLVANDRLGAGLAPIHSQEKLHGGRFSLPAGRNPARCRKPREALILLL